MREWLATNQAGSFAMGCASRLPERKYHGALIIRQPGANHPLHVLAEVGETLVAPGQCYELASFRYGDVIHPDPQGTLRSFTSDPHPVWVYECDGMTLRRELELVEDRDEVRIHYHLSDAPSGTELHLAPFFTARDVHSLAHENPYLDGNPIPLGRGAWRFQLYTGFPAVDLGIEPPAPLVTQGHWNRRVEYAEEARRGYSGHEDLYCPGYLRVLATGGELRCTVRVAVPRAQPVTPLLDNATDATPPVAAMSALIGRLQRAADCYLYRESHSQEPGIIAGFPWFGDWARDTLISLPGMLIAQGRHELARMMLARISALRVEGLVPRLLCSSADDNPEPCADATLWFIRAVECLERAAGAETTRRLWYAVVEMVQALESRRFAGNGVGEDGLLYVDRRPLASTWMDAEVDGQAVTARAPLAVEIQGLFLQAVRYATEIAARLGRPGLVGRWQMLSERQRRSFRERFWNPATGHLNDAHDGDHADAALRPNQLIALTLTSRNTLSPDEQRSALSAVRRALWTPFGLRTLDPAHAAYRGQCQGSQRERDLAYHQGTVWPWLLGPYLDAVAAIEGPEAVSWELNRSIPALDLHLDEGCAGHVAEIFDGDAPHPPRGAPAQAWSVAELLRVSLTYGARAVPPGAAVARQQIASVRCEP